MVAVATRPALPASAAPGIGFGLLAAATFGTSGVVATPMLEAGWSAGAVVLVRISTAAALLVGPALLALRGRRHLLRRQAPQLLAFGVLAIAVAQVCFFNAVRHLSVGVALLLEYSGIVLVVGYQWWRSRVRPSRPILIGMVCALGGLALVLNDGSATRLSIAGVLWGVGAATGLAVFYLLAADDDAGVPALVTVTAGMVVGAVALAFAGLVGALPIRVSGADVHLAGLTLNWMIPAGWLAVVTAALAYLAGVAATRRLGSTMASFLGLSEVLFAVLLAWLVLDETMLWLQIVGGAAVIAGVALVRWGELRR